MFFERLKALLQEQNKTKKELSEALGIGINTIKRWETTGRSPNNVTLSGIATYFGVSVDYLLGKTDEKQSDSDIGILNESEKRMLRLFRSVPKEKQDYIIQAFEGLLKG